VVNTRNDRPLSATSTAWNFVLPGAIIVAFAATYSAFRIIRLHGLHLEWTWINAVYLVLWLILALAFGVVAIRCGKTQRVASLFAWITCAAASLRGLYWGFLLVDDARNGTHFAYSHYLPLVTGVALIAFGIASHRPFRWWWSAPAFIAGFLDARASALGLYRAHPYVSLIWLVLLVILGIAMSRTRVGSRAVS